MTSRETTVRRLAFWSIPLALAVMGLKFIAWQLTGSVALFSDALESIVNVIAAMVAFVAVSYAQKPADADHPFGHHKAEYFSAVIEGVLIVLAALLIVREAVAALVSPGLITAPVEGIAVNIFAGLINGVWAMVLIREGRAFRSPALEADGRHILTDVISSGGVIVGLVLALWLDVPILDPILALLVAGNVLWQGWKVIGSSVAGLMDGAVAPDEEERIRQLIAAHATGAIEAHDIKSRRAGYASFVEFHLVVDGDMTVETSHQICDRLENVLRREVPGVKVTIHVEPGHKAKDEGVVL
ncbi:cation diffusion facilitator family transporter [Pseudohoeflea coraliihabitans]|uniref:Cation diffusion facilitator family transporter n=1 Tax=Pseudohoeflea coraliihabitans TaxID=2860393 RepID=A0ABS6WJL5_9HYPH|nr:cation diffusion facilitator family transporter [Pseudohoeflea sp. DP4N28-3]MBW3096142.1 cation diffusion facilitator family transporter [Pseudohoeflea sp. DP4N28-3]